ncbi:response regulator [Silvibacterium sp.]|uniref:response regulator n=1 Tax=Silvibacterium sp. TaxID=1964179 RepID=UPI0039E5C30C
MLNEPIRLLLVDDHTLFREGIARLLEAEERLELIAHFASAREAIASSALDRSDVVLLDYDLGESNGLQLLQEMRGRRPEIKVLMVTAGLDQAAIAQALRDGASGIFLKHSAPTDLIQAILMIVRGGSWIDSSILSKLSAPVPSLPRQETRPALDLTTREQSVLNGVFEGLTNKEIATTMSISESYVKALLQQLFEKTGVRTRSQLVRVALERQRSE